MSELKSRLSDLLSLYLTMLSLFEAIILEQLVSRVAEVSGGAFFEGWTIGLLVQALIVLMSALFMWVGFMTLTAPIRRTILGSDFLMPFVLGSVQLLAIQVMEREIEPAFLTIFVVAYPVAYVAVRNNIQAARSDKVSAVVAKLFQMRKFAGITGMLAGATVIGAVSLHISRVVGNVFAGIALFLITVLVVSTLRWWNSFVSMHRINDATSTSPLKQRVTGLLSIYLTLVSFIEAVVLEQLISRAALVSSGHFLEGWTLDLGLQVAVVFTSAVTIWVAFLTDLIPIRRVMYSSDLVNVIGIGLVQMIAIQLLDTEIQPGFLLVVGLGGIGGALTRHQNHIAARTDPVAKGLVRLYPHRQMMVLMSLMVPVGVFGALGMWFFSLSGNTAAALLALLFLLMNMMLMGWWTKVVKMRRLQ